MNILTVPAAIYCFSFLGQMPSAFGKNHLLSALNVDVMASPIGAGDRPTFGGALQVVAAEGEAQRLIRLAVLLGVVGLGVALGPVCHLQVQHLERERGGERERERENKRGQKINERRKVKREKKKKSRSKKGAERQQAQQRSRARKREQGSTFQ